MNTNRVKKLRQYLNHRYKILKGVCFNDLVEFVSYCERDYRDLRHVIKIIDYSRVSSLSFYKGDIKINDFDIPNQQNIIAIYKRTNKGFKRYAHRKGIRWIKDR